MEETKITANLPNLDVEITRRELPEANAETITLRMTAAPSFEAFADYLAKQGSLSLLPLGAAATMNLWTSPWANPFLTWARLTQAAWAPLLAPTLPRVTQNPRKAGSRQEE